MKVRSLIIAILTGVIALSIVGANAYGWVIEHRWALPCLRQSILLLNRTIRQPPATAIFVPKNASAVISLLANLDDLGNLHRLVTPRDKKRLEYHAIAQWKQQLADRVHLDYQREIAPWLGEEITVAITEADLDRNIRNGIDLAHWRGQLTNIVPPLEQLLATVERTVGEISTKIGIDSTTDIFNWATGEYALAAIPNPTHKVTDWVFVAERTQPELVDTAIAHFDELARLAGYNVGLLPWENRSVIGWTKLATETNPTNPTQLVAQVPFTHTTIAGYTILASSVEAMDSTLKAIDKKSIIDSDRYNSAIDLISANQTGYIYGNWDTIESLLPKQPLIRSFAEGIFSGLPNISLNNYIDSETQRVTVLFQVD